MSSKGLTANFNRSCYRSFEWLISHRKRPVILSVVRAVAQLTRDNINRYPTDLKREIDLKVRLLNSKTLREAQNFASETGRWIKESHQLTKQQIAAPRSPTGFRNKPTLPPRTLANTTPQKAYNRNMPLVDRSQMKCNKCGKVGHFAAQCFTYRRNFQKDTSQK